MQTNEAGIALIKRFEGLRLAVYRCPSNVWTIGYGHTGDDINAHSAPITEEVAEQLLRQDLQSFEAGVSRALGSRPATSDQFSAMICLAFNIGLL